MITVSHTLLPFSFQRMGLLMAGVYIQNGSGLFYLANKSSIRRFFSLFVSAALHTYNLWRYLNWLNVVKRQLKELEKEYQRWQETK